jgi:hypothetical protein
MFLVVCFGMFFVMLSMAEMASMFLSYIVGIVLSGLWTAILSADQVLQDGCALLVGKPPWLPLPSLQPNSSKG